MKNKRIACRGMLVLLVVLGLCLFLSGTLKTMVTPKVQFVNVKSGRLTSHLQLPCRLVYRDAEELRRQVPDGVMVGRCLVRAGDQVKAGDALFSLRFRQEKEMEKQLTGAYYAALKAEMDFSRENKLRPRKAEEAYFAAYQALESAVIQEGDARLTVERLFPIGSVLPEEGMLEGVDKALTDAVNAYRTCQAERAAAEEALEKASAYEVRSSALQHLTQKQQIEMQIQTTREALLTFQEARDAMKTVTAPHDGYIAEVSVRAGDSYDGTTPLCLLTSEAGGPALEANLGEQTEKGLTQASITLETEWGDFPTQMTEVELNQDGQLCAYIALPQELLDLGVSLRRAAASTMTADVAIQSEEAHALIPVSAIHGVGNNRYVYMVEESASVLGGTEMKVRACDVTVLAEAEGMAAVAEPLNRVRLAYREDKELSNGSTVMGGAE